MTHSIFNPPSSRHASAQPSLHQQLGAQHTLQPPPSSFSRSSAAVKSSLKKIPSAIFTRSPERKTVKSTLSRAPIYVVDSAPAPKATSRSFFNSPKRMSASNHPSANTAKPAQPVFADKKEETKSKKTRKALADILGWGNSNSTKAAAPPHKPDAWVPPVIPGGSVRYTNPPPSIKSPTESAPPVPAKDNMLNGHAVLKKRTSRPLSNKSSQSAFSTFSSLRSPSANDGPHQSRARPSMAPDPFSRHEGAEVVDVVYRHGTPSLRSSTKGSISGDRRVSVASSKAMSGRLTIGEESIKEQAETLLPEPQTNTEVQQHTFSRPQQRPPTNGAAYPHQPLTDLPIRSASLGRVLESTRVPPVSIRSNQVPTFRPLAVEPPADATLQQDFRTLKKAKTRSKVWGIFGKSRKDKSPTIDLDSRPAKILPSSHSVLSSISNSTNEAFTGTAPSFRSGSTRFSNQSALGHQSDPRSVNEQAGPSARHQAAESIRGLRTHDSTATLRPSAYVYRPVVEAPALSKHDYTTAPRGVSTISGQDLPVLTGKAVPKRKSLSGLFGLAMKTSLDKLRPQRATLQPVSRAERPQMVDPSSRNFATVQPSTARSLAAEMQSAQKEVEKDGASTLPYLTKLQIRNEDPIRQPNGTLRRVASATDKLLNLVTATNDFSPTPSEQSSLAAPPSLASLDSSPTPVRRVKSAVLTSKKSAGSPLKTQSNISPLKLALHRSQVAKKVPPPSFKAPPVFHQTPPRTSMVKKGMKNVFAPTPPREGDGRMPPKPRTALRPLDSQGNIPKPLNATLDPYNQLPADLKRILATSALKNRAERAESGDHPTSSSISSTSQSQPLVHRQTPRRADHTPAPSAVPEVPAQRREPSRYGLSPPRLTLNLIPGDINFSPSSSYFSDSNTPTLGTGEYRNSFDFTSEYASLDRGDQRASFVETMMIIQNQPPAQVPLPPVPAMPPLPISMGHDVGVQYEDYDYEETDSEMSDGEDDLEMVAVEMGSIHSGLARSGSVCSAIHVEMSRTPRPKPFEGNVAFQKHIAETKRLSSSPPRSRPISHFSDETIEPAREPEVDEVEVEEQEQPTEVVPRRRRGHARDESGFSIASMSSMGSVIDTRLDKDDVTNYFEVNFSNHLAEHEGAPPPLPPLPAHLQLGSQGLSNPPSRDSLRSRRHRRNSSLVSIDSLDEMDLGVIMTTVNNLTASGPPVSMHNTRRSSYISRHRRGLGSGDGSLSLSSFGRSDWKAHHRRNSSQESNASAMSVARLARPGLGERMFQLDGGVQLTSISASPPAHPNSETNDARSLTGSVEGLGFGRRGRGPLHRDQPSLERLLERNRLENRDQDRQLLDESQLPLQYDSVLDDSRLSDSVLDDARPPYDSILDDSQAPYDSLIDSSRLVYDSLMDSTMEASSVETHHSQASGSFDIDTTFGTRTRQGGSSGSFLIKGLRPISAISNDSSAPSDVENTFTGMRNKVKRPTQLEVGSSPVPKGPTACLSGEGQDESMSRSELDSSTTSGRQILNTSMSRPAKPKRRPANLVFDHFTPETPVLSSPSASESSSRLSLDTKYSERIYGASRGRPHGAGHNRQKSSLNIMVQATIREEPSIASLKYKTEGRLARDSVENWVDGEAGYKVKEWIDWKREADDEFKRTQTCWQDSEESKMALAEFKVPSTAKEIADFLAKSSAAYKPLDQLPLGRIAHRRKSSLSNSRLFISPYGLPLPRPPTLPTSTAHSDYVSASSAATAAKPKRMSIETKFERSNSATSSNFTFGSRPSSTPSEVIEVMMGISGTPSRAQRLSAPPMSSVFAPFAGSGSSGSTPPSTSASSAFGNAKFDLPFKPYLDKTSKASDERAQKEKVEDKRPRVDSTARREALGWGRRRNSDGPTKVEATVKTAFGKAGDSVKSMSNAGAAPLGDRTNGVAKMMTRQVYTDAKENSAPQQHVRPSKLPRLVVKARTSGTLPRSLRV